MTCRCIQVTCSIPAQCPFLMRPSDAFQLAASWLFMMHVAAALTYDLADEYNYSCWKPFPVYSTGSGASKWGWTPREVNNNMKYNLISLCFTQPLRTRFCAIDSITWWHKQELIALGQVGEGRVKDMLPHTSVELGRTRGLGMALLKPLWRYKILEQLWDRGNGLIRVLIFYTWCASL